MERFIKRYLTPNGRYRVLNELVDKRYQRMIERMDENREEILNYISQMPLEEFEKTRFYFYQLLVSQETINDNTFLSFGRHSILKKI